MLKQLWKLKQGQKEMEDFIMEFENLKLLSKISDDHALKILQTNVSWDSMKQFVVYYYPLANYKGLKGNLIEIDKSEAYLKVICYPMFTPFFCPHVPVPQTLACQLPQGTPMEADHQQCSTTSTCPFTVFRGNCYNCGQADHSVRDCPTPHPCHCRACMATSILFKRGNQTDIKESCCIQTYPG